MTTEQWQVIANIYKAATAAQLPQPGLCPQAIAIENQMLLPHHPPARRGEQDSADVRSERTTLSPRRLARATRPRRFGGTAKTARRPETGRMALPALAQSSALPHIMCDVGAG
ncbi:MAG: hypothetical protein H6668_13215 [Ardenticatenaceae bacterium]|nr:hypothetical protein [Ardenticatenaceae bacterium]